MGRFIDLKKWKRREHFEMFRRYEQPFFSVCVQADATALWRYCRASGGPPFFLTSLFLMLRAANQTEALRLRLRGRRVWLHDEVAVGTTVLRPDSTFTYARVDPSERLRAFVAGGEAEIARGQRRKTLGPRGAGRDDLVYHSTLPWLHFTAITNALRRADSIPRVVFGRCRKDGRSMVMPVGVEVHHALVDGFDVAQFLERFQTGLSRVPKGI